jgi:hypothetical protein
MSQLPQQSASYFVRTPNSLVRVDAADTPASSSTHVLRHRITPVNTAFAKPRRSSKGKRHSLPLSSRAASLPALQPNVPNKNRRLDRRRIQHCLFYAKFGKCTLAQSASGCSFVHDPTAIGVCRSWLVGRCPHPASACRLSHAVDKDKMPVCERFLHGRCPRPKDACPYLHVSHAADARLCEPFALRGFCPSGARCSRVHTWDCLEFCRTGTCPTRESCRLRHWSSRRRDRAQNTPDFREDDSGDDDAGSGIDEVSDSDGEDARSIPGDEHCEQVDSSRGSSGEQNDRDGYISLSVS